MSAPFSPNQRFSRLFLLKSIDERSTKSGKPYLSLLLGTPEGDFEGRFWDMEARALPGLVEGDPVKVGGVVQLYQDKIQLIADGIEKVETSVDPREIYPSSSVPEEKLREDFSAFVEGIGDPELKALMGEMERDEKAFQAFFITPAARAMHHAYIGGLAQHSLDVCRMALAISRVSPGLDRDMLTVGALLHDIGKIAEYEVGGDFRYTLDGKLVGHLVRGFTIVERWIEATPGFPERLSMELLHIILSHHGQLELGSPKLPVTAEALVIHYCDDLDAKLEMVRTAALEAQGPEAYVRGLRRTFQLRVEGEDKKTVQRPTTNVQREEGGKTGKSPTTNGQGEKKKNPEFEIQSSEMDVEGPKSKIQREKKSRSPDDDDQGELF